MPRRSQQKKDATVAVLKSIGQKRRCDEKVSSWERAKLEAGLSSDSAETSDTDYDPSCYESFDETNDCVVYSSGSRAKKVVRTRQSGLPAEPVPSAAKYKSTKQLGDLPVEVLALILQYVCDNQAYLRLGFLLKLRRTARVLYRASEYTSVWSFVDISSALKETRTDRCLEFFMLYFGPQTRGLRLGRCERLNKEHIATLFGRCPNVKYLELCTAGEKFTSRVFEELSAAHNNWQLKRLAVVDSNMNKKTLSLLDRLGVEGRLTHLLQLNVERSWRMSNAFSNNLHHWQVANVEHLVLSADWSNPFESSLALPLTAHWPIFVKSFPKLKSLCLLRSTIGLITTEQQQSDVVWSDLRSLELKHEIGSSDRTLDAELRATEWLSIRCPNLNQLNISTTPQYRNANTYSRRFAFNWTVKFLSVSSAPLTQLTLTNPLYDAQLQELKPNNIFWENIEHLSVTNCNADCLHWFLTHLLGSELGAPKLKCLDVSNTDGDVNAKLFKAAFKKCPEWEELNSTGCRWAGRGRRKLITRRQEIKQLIHDL